LNCQLGIFNRAPLCLCFLPRVSAQNGAGASYIYIIMGSESYTLGHNSLDILVPTRFFHVGDDKVGKKVLFDMRIMDVANNETWR